MWAIPYELEIDLFPLVLKFRGKIDGNGESCVSVDCPMAYVPVLRHRGAGRRDKVKSQSVVHLFRGVPQAKLSFFITLIESFLDMASVPTIRVIFDRRHTGTITEKRELHAIFYLL